MVTKATATLLCAAYAGDVAAMAQALAHGAKINEPDALLERTALMKVCARGHLDGVKLLLKGHANLDVMCRAGWTALGYAVFGGHTTVVLRLVDAGAKMDRVGNDGDPALVCAIRTRHTKIIEVHVRWVSPVGYRHTIRTHRHYSPLTGGSRGNPGPGGAGAVVIRTDRLRTAPSLVWSAATSLAAASTSNNQAEYTGLVNGLVAADRHHWRPLKVVGDSQLIIRQHDLYRPPKNDKLLPLYCDCVLADRLGIARWHHHLRAFNKSADAAANIAMDSRRSIHSFHPSRRPEWANLHLHVADDFLHWRAAGDRAR